MESDGRRCDSGILVLCSYMTLHLKTPNIPQLLQWKWKGKLDHHLTLWHSILNFTSWALMVALFKTLLFANTFSWTLRDASIMIWDWICSLRYWNNNQRCIYKLKTSAFLRTIPCCRNAKIMLMQEKIFQCHFRFQALYVCTHDYVKIYT